MDLNRKRHFGELGANDDDSNLILDAQPPPKKRGRKIEKNENTSNVSNNRSGKDDVSGESQSWACHICTFINPGIVLQCKICNTIKTTNKTQNKKNIEKRKDGDNKNKKSNNNDNNNINIDDTMDEATRNAIYALMSCNSCNKYNSDKILIELGCNHIICQECGKKYLVNGINKKLWEIQAILCPITDCNHTITQTNLTQFLSNNNKNDENNNNNSNSNNNNNNSNDSKENCNYNNLMESIEKQQRTFVISMNSLHTIQCPKCKFYFASEKGDYENSNSNNSSNNNSNGKKKQKQKKKKRKDRSGSNKSNNSNNSDSTNDTNDTNDSNDENLSHRISANEKHKLEWRFRCSQCNTIFCGQCHTIPYHNGRNCQEYANYLKSRKCRFCEAAIDNENNNNGNENSNNNNRNDSKIYSLICNKAECIEKQNNSCEKILDCGHPCIGIKNETKCMDCIHSDCIKLNNNKNGELGSMQSSDDYCNICWVDPLSSESCIKLECNHIFHYNCILNKLNKKWPSARITFNFLNCPLCKKEMCHESLNNIKKEHIKLKNDIIKMGIERLKFEELLNDPRLTNKESRYYNNVNQFALDRLAFYLCNKCNSPYFGGMKSCDQVNSENEEKYDASTLICGSCSSGNDKNTCATHGKDYISYKCRYCCKQAVWFCFGNTHYCEPCHQKAFEVKNMPIDKLPKCPGKDKCPLKIDHPPNGTDDFSLGCVICLRK